MDMERLETGKLSSRMDCERGWSAPPPAPCMMRAKRMMPREGAAPQKKEATVKMVTQMSRKRLRPKRRGSQVGAGGGGEGGSCSAKEGGHREDGDADEQKALAAEAAGEPVGGGEDDSVGDQVAGEHPGGLGVGGRERAGNVRQGHRGNGGVEHLHKGGEHDGHNYQPRVDALGERG